MEMDRKIVVVLLARELHKYLEDFVHRSAGHIRSYLEAEPEEFAQYILDALPEAVALVKVEKSV